jgi:hypothetical protein
MRKETASKRIGTSANQMERPMTSNKAMGYSNKLGKDPKEVECKIKNK